MQPLRLTALCSICFAQVSAVEKIDGQSVLLHKNCAVHGEHSSLLATDSSYWGDVWAESTADIVHAAKTQRRPLMLFVEVIDECDLECTTCIAGSLVGAGNARDPDSLVQRIAAIASPDLISHEAQPSPQNRRRSRRQQLHMLR